MLRKTFYLSFIILVGFTCSNANADDIRHEIEQLKARITELEKKLAEDKDAEPEAELSLDEALDQARQEQQPDEPEPDEFDYTLEETLAQAQPEQPEPFSPGQLDFAAGSQQAMWQSMNPEISVVFDGNFSAGDKLEDIFENIRGFGAGPEFEKGFNLRDVELHVAADVDPYFTAFATFEFNEEEALVEEAVIRDTFLPWGLQLQAGRFLSNIGRINVQHAHDWDFVDRPLVNRLMFDGSLDDIGAQLSWLLPTEQYAMAGIEVFQGDNDGTFNYIGDRIADHSGPRAVTGWFKYSPDTPANHETQFGTFAGYGRHQEEYDLRLVDGYSTFLGFDAVYKYRRPGQHYGHGNVTFEGEYIYRWQDLDYVSARDTTGDDFSQTHPLVGQTQENRQDGYYLQGAYGFAPRWRAGLRWDHVGLTNHTNLHDGRDDFGESYRAAAMVDFTPTEFSRFRVQGGRGSYDTYGGREKAWDLFFQLIVSIGPHGAHEF